MSIFKREKTEPFFATHVWVDDGKIHLVNAAGKKWHINSEGYEIDGLMFEIAKNILERIAALEERGEEESAEALAAIKERT